MYILSVLTQFTEKLLLRFALFIYFFIIGVEKLLSSQNNVAPGLSKEEGKLFSASPS